MTHDISPDKSENMIFMFGLSIAALILLGMGVYLCYSLYVGQSETTALWVPVAIIVNLVGGTILAIRVLLNI